MVRQPTPVATAASQQTSSSSSIVAPRHFVNWRNIAVTLKIPRLENQSVFDTWTLAKIVRKVEFKLLQIIVRAPGLLGVVPGYC